MNISSQFPALVGANALPSLADKFAKVKPKPKKKAPRPGKRSSVKTSNRYSDGGEI